MACFQPFPRKSSFQRCYFSRRGIANFPCEADELYSFDRPVFLYQTENYMKKMKYTLARYWNKSAPGRRAAKSSKLPLMTKSMQKTKIPTDRFQRTRWSWWNLQSNLTRSLTGHLWQKLIILGAIFSWWLFRYQLILIDFLIDFVDKRILLSD